MGVFRLSDADVTGLAWVNDKRLLLTVANVGSDEAEPTGAPGLFAIDADGSGLLQLTERWGWHLTTTSGDALSSPVPMVPANVRLIGIPMSKSGERNEEVLLLQGSLSQHADPTPLWVNTRTRAQRPDYFDLPGRIINLWLDPAGAPRVALVREDGKLKGLRRTPGSTQWVPMLRGPERDPLPAIFGIDLQGSIYGASHVGADGHAVLVKHEDIDGALRTAVVADIEGFDFEGGIVQDASTGDTVGIRIHHARETTLWKTPALRALQASVDRLLPGLVNRIECRRCESSDMVALITSYSAQNPGHLRVYRAQPPDSQPAWLDLGPLYPEIDPSRMASVDFKLIRARDGATLPVWITRPQGIDGPAPAVVLVHGGPWVRGGYWTWRSEPQFLASHGYLVIEPEMRGSRGYGLRHLESGYKQYGQAMQDDVADALLWARKTGLADDRACIMGASYGGYSALMGLVKHPELYRCAIATAALTDLDLYVDGSFWVWDDITPEGRKRDLPRWVGDPKLDAAMLAANSPVHQAARIKAPLLLMHGEKDQRVPLAHAERLRRALTAAGRPPEWATYPDEGHGGWKPSTKIDMTRRIEAFLSKHLSAP